MALIILFIIDYLCTMITKIRAFIMLLSSCEKTHAINEQRWQSRYLAEPGF